MPIAAFAFLLGNILVHQLPRLSPNIWWMLIPLIPSSIFLIKRIDKIFKGKHKRIIQNFVYFCLSGFIWTCCNALVQLEQTKAFDGGEFDLLLEVTSIPSSKSIYASFIAKVIDAPQAKFPQKLRLNLYDKSAIPVLGEQIQAKVRLKPRYGPQNPGGFDFEKLMFSQRIGASGYIRSWHSAAPPGILQKLRQTIYQRMLAGIGDSENRGPILALAMGERGAMTAAQWELLAATGTGHLFAISGLHIALIFGLMFKIGQWLWRYCFLPRTEIPEQSAAILFALPWAFIYAWIAGFSIPTRRALLMLTCVVITHLAMRRVSLLNTTGVALLAILLADPFSTLSASFWLSFFAVMMIAVYLNMSRTQLRRWQWLGLYCYLPIAMLLAGLYFFGQGAVLAPLANLFAIPYTSFLLLPSILLATAFSLINETLHSGLIAVADALLNCFWAVAAWIKGIDFSRWFYAPAWWTYLPAFVGVVAIVLLSDLRGKIAASILISALAFSSPPKLSYGEFSSTFLDVGQGLSVVISTQRHHLLFDAGPAYSSGFNLGSAVVVPYLLSEHITALDAAVISHGDNDHSGGMDFVLERIEAKKIFAGGVGAGAGASGTDDNSADDDFIACQRDIRWQWDGVYFEFLHPSKETLASGNDASCVLKIGNEAHTLLLTADIERRAERELLEKMRAELRSDVLSVPHHGSKTSSGPRFLDAVNPKIAVVSAGFRNRFGFPNEKIVGAYLDRCIQFHNTANSGAIRIDFASDDKIDLSHYRLVRQRYWHRINENPYVLPAGICGEDG